VATLNLKRQCEITVVSDTDTQEFDGEEALTRDDTLNGANPTRRTKSEEQRQKLYSYGETETAKDLCQLRSDWKENTAPQRRQNWIL
jgi:hypothetical protein